MRPRKSVMRFTAAGPAAEQPAGRRRYEVASMDVRVLVHAVRVAGGAALDLRDDLCRDVAERLRRRGRRIEHHDRLPTVAPHHHLRIDGHLAEEGDAEHLRSALSAAVSEDLLALAAVPADE